MIRDQKNLKIREQIFKRLFVASDLVKSSFRWFIGLCRFCFTVSMLLSLFAIILYFGFTHTEANILKLISAFRILFLILFVSKFLMEIFSYRGKSILTSAFEIFILLFTLVVFLSNFGIVTSNKPFWAFFYGNIPILISIFVLVISEISIFARLISAINFPPALIFALSFLVIIFLGSGLLMLPRAHTLPLSFLDSLFTSVSAVCVTGLIVVDTATSFTPLGKIILLSLIQIGGLGIMTFTGFFSFIFTSSSSFRDRLLLKEIFSSRSLENLFRLLNKIILWTFMTEIAGAILIYYSIDIDSDNKFFFSLFHSVSAFCNAGFSTLSNGLFSSGLKHNYSVQITVALLIILGGIGFPVLLKIFSYFKQLVIGLLRKILNKRIHNIHTQMNISGRMAVVMTLILIVAGTGLYYLFESGESLNGMSLSDKFIISFFGSVSARTAGFNVMDISLWGYPTIFLMIFLMWIGASPGSTGGGIKTTTFFIAFRSAYNSIKGRNQLTIGNREIGSGTIARVLAIIFLSIMIITFGFFFLLLSEPEKNPVHLIFECVSAFSTVGLSIAGTSNFSQTGKIVLIFLMFIGRVGPLTLLIGLMFSYRKRYAQYPEIDIVIN